MSSRRHSPDSLSSRKSWELAVGIQIPVPFLPNDGDSISGLAAISLCWLSYLTKESKCPVSHRKGGPLEALCSRDAFRVGRPSCHR